MQLVTTVHTFLDAQGRSRGKCQFRNHESPPQIIDIDLTAAHRFGKTGPRTPEELNDYAVVRLKEPVKDAVPFRTDTAYLQQNEWVIGVAASQKSPTRQFERYEPVVQRCRNRDIYSVPGAPVQYITDCDLSPLGSGGIVYTKNANGAMVVKGIFAATGNEGLNGQPYNTANGSYTRVVGINGTFTASIQEIRNSIPIQTANLKD